MGAKEASLAISTPIIFRSFDAEWHLNTTISLLFSPRYGALELRRFLVDCRGLHITIFTHGEEHPPSRFTRLTFWEIHPNFIVKVLKN
jgi:hypothetical protein